MFRIRLIVLCAGVMGLALPLRSVKMDREIKTRQTDLDRIQETLREKKLERAAAERKQKELASEVHRRSQELRSAQESLSGIKTRVRETERRRKSVEERLWVSRLGIGQWGGLLASELKIYYERRMVRNAAASVEMAYRHAAIQEKVRGLSFARQQHAQVEELRDEMLDLEVQLQKLRLNKEKEEERVQAAKVRMQALHKTVQGRRAILEREIKDLQSSAKELSKLIDKLIQQKREEEARQSASGVSPRGRKSAANRQKGRLPWPLEGKVIERYGRSRHPELDTYVFSNGIKLRTDSSAPVRAIEKGEVLYAGAFMGYGLMALIQHPDNLHTVYGHLGDLNVKRGQTVSVGEIIGVSGQDEEGRSLVYFELRVGGVAVDPLLWLQ